MTQPDIIVIGGGLAGLSVAWHLSFTHRVLVLERGAQLGAEASAQNAGLVRLLDEDPVDRSLALRTEQFFGDLAGRWTGDNPTRQTGAMLSLAHDKYALHDAAAWVRAAGIAIEAVADPAALAPALTRSETQFNWYLPTARVADPRALIHGYTAGLLKRGGSVHTHTRVSSLLLERDRIVGVQTHTGPLFCDKVVIAAGAWSGPLGPQWKAPLHPIRRTLFQTEAHRLSQPDHPWCWIDDVGCYVRPEAGGWLCSPCDERPDPPASLGSSTGQPEAALQGLMTEKLKRWFPALGAVQFRSGWSGLRTFATDRRPIIGADPKSMGLWWATGLGGFGVTTSYAVGEALSCWMTGEPTPWLAREPMAPTRRYPSRWVVFPEGDAGDGCVVESSPLPDVQEPL
jgi:glycine/D-amino acid oxidase-like deaminating enzyme